MFQLIPLNMVHSESGHFCKVSTPSHITQLAQFCFEQVSAENGATAVASHSSFVGTMELLSYENAAANSLLNVADLKDILRNDGGAEQIGATAIKIRINSKEVWNSISVFH